MHLNAALYKPHFTGSLELPGRPERSLNACLRRNATLSYDSTTGFATCRVCSMDRA